MKRAFARERFDVVHVHEPVRADPVALRARRRRRARSSPPATLPADGGGCGAKRCWGTSSSTGSTTGIAVSEPASAAAAEPFIDGPFEIIPNGVALPERPIRGGPRAPRRLRRPPRAAQGPAGAPARLARDSRRTGARLRLMGADPLAVRFLLRRLGGAGRRDRHPRRCDRPRLVDARSPARRSLVGSGDRLRELRHGADRGVRRRDAGRRLRHPGLPRGRDAGHRHPRPAGRRARRSSRRSSTCSRTSRGARRSASAPARSRRSATRGTGSLAAQLEIYVRAHGQACRRGGRRRVTQALLGTRRGRTGILLAAVAAVAGVLVWRALRPPPGRKAPSGRSSGAGSPPRSG